MGEEERFYSKQLDRTPYGACAWLAVVVIVFWLIMAWLLWQAGSLVQSKLTHFSSPHFHIALPNKPDPQAALNAAKQQAAAAAQAQADQALEQGKEQAEAAAKQKAAEAAASASPNLNQFLNQ